MDEGSIFQNGNIPFSTPLQNVEEDEELEDQKRRQEEIESYLKNAMDEFNYDDQSTIASSNASIELNTKYLEAPVGNHLEVLYNIRVKEVETLSFEVEQLKQQITDEQTQQARKLLLAEAETDSLRISLKNAQELIVEKCANLEKCVAQKSALQQDFEHLAIAMKKMDQENYDLHQANENLTEQVAILEKGRGANPLSNALIQEAHLAEIAKLQTSLETAISKSHRLEKENTALNDRLSSALNEKDDAIASKTEIINRLMLNVERAQEQNQELLSSNQKLQTECDRLRNCVKDLETNMQIMKGFTDKTEIIKMLQQELEKSKQQCSKLFTDFEQVQSKYSQACKTLQEKNEFIASLKHSLAILQIKPSTECNGMQTSFLSETRLETIHFNELIAAKDEEIERLKEERHALENDCLTLNKKLELSEQKNTLTAELQEKAHQLEEILLNNQKSLGIDKSINTSFVERVSDDVDIKLLRAQFAQELIERELLLQKELEKEFEQRCAKLPSENCKKCEEFMENMKQIESNVQVANETCNDCKEVKMQLTKNEDSMQNQQIELQQLRETQQKDRIVIVKVLQEWKERFQTIELERQELLLSLESAQQEAMLMKTAESQLLSTVRNKAENVVQQCQRNVMQQVQMQNMQIQKTITNIETMSQKTDLHIQEIERNFNKAQSDLKLLHVKNAQTRQE